MTPAELQNLLERVASGQILAADAATELTAVLRAQPFEDIGFARVDHHRALRQGFPEVVLGLGKTPSQIAAISARIAAQGQTLLVTRASAEAFEAVEAAVPGAQYHEVARTITLQRGDIKPGNGVVVVAAAGTSDLPVAEEAAVTAEVMGNTVDRLFDVGFSAVWRAAVRRSPSRADEFTAAVLRGSLLERLDEMMAEVARAPAADGDGAAKESRP